LFAWDFLLIELPEVPSYGAIETILYKVVVSTIEMLCNKGPFVSVLALVFKNFYFIFKGKTVFIEVGVQVVVPAFSALFS